MSPNWPLATLVAIGHLGVFVYLTNVSHAIGWSPRWLGVTNKLIVGTAFLLACGLAGCLLAGMTGVWTWPILAYASLCLLVAVIVIPACSLVAHFRRLPEGISERSSELDLAKVHGADALIGDGRYASLLRIKANDSFRLRKRDWTVTLPSLPPVWDGLSIVQISDLHFAPCFQRRFFELVVDEAAEWQADLVVFTGDIVDSDAAIDWIVPIMSRLHGRLGAYSILGNHDFIHQPMEVRDRLVDAGFIDLEGRWTQLEIEGITMSLGGTSTPWGPNLDLDAAADADFRLLLSHSPDQFPHAVNSGIDLMLSGHNHGGQIRLPGIGPVFMPSLYSRRFDRGYFRSGRTLLHVSQGVAGKHPIRIGCIPEISRLVLRVGREPALDAANPSQTRIPHDASTSLT